MYSTEETSRLALRPAEFYIKKIIRRKYVLKNQADKLQEENRTLPCL